MCHVNCNENKMNIYIFLCMGLKKFGMIYSDLDHICLYACKHDFDYFSSSRIS
jgi:hypothetical protein